LEDGPVFGDRFSGLVVTCLATLAVTYAEGITIKTQSVHLFRASYLLALVLLGVVILFGYWTWHDSIEKLRGDALQVNLSGRQRMLVERVGSLSLALSHAADPVDREQLRKQISATLAQLRFSHDRLLKDFGQLSPELRRLYFEGPVALEDRLFRFINLLEAFLEAPEIQPLQAGIQMQSIHDEVASMVAVFDRLAGQYQRDNEQSIHNAIVLDSFMRGVTLLLLLATGLFIFRPMEKRIRREHNRELQIVDDALQDSRDELQKLYDGAPDMLLSFDPRTERVVRCNATAAETLGYTREELLGLHRRGLYAPDCHELLDKAFEDFLAMGRSDDVELQVVCKDGSLIDVSLSATQYRDSDGQFLFSDVILRDIRERKRAEEQVLRRDRQLTTLHLLGEQMLLSTELYPLMHNIAFCLYESLAVKRVAICELVADGNSLIPQAAVGVPRTLLGDKSYPVAPSSIAAKSLSSDRPVYSSALNSKRWLDGLDFLPSEQVRSGVAAVIRGSSGPLGMILALSAEANGFSTEEIDYIQSLANLLGVTADRIQVEHTTMAQPLSRT
jgi:PAS domain S-box-containing protein